MTIDRSIPIVPGRSSPGFHRPGRHCLHQARSALICWGKRMEGELHPTCEADFLAHRWQRRMHLSSFRSGHFRRWRRAYYVTASWAPYRVHTARARDTVICTGCGHFPCGGQSSPPHRNNLTRPPAEVTARKQNRCPGSPSSRSDKRFFTAALPTDARTGECGWLVQQPPSLCLDGVLSCVYTTRLPRLRLPECIGATRPHHAGSDRPAAVRGAGIPPPA